MRSLLALLALLALLLASAAHAQAPSPAQMGITSTTSPEVLQTLDSGKTWVPVGRVDPITHTFGSSIDPRDYGAKCDGATDDSVAIQNAINVVQAMPGGGAVVIPPSANGCLSNSTLNITASNLTLMGAQMGGAAILFNTGTANDLSVGNGRAGSVIYNINIHDLQIKEVASNKLGGYSISFVNVGSSTINNVQTWGSFNGLLADKINNLVVYNTVFNGYNGDLGHGIDFVTAGDGSVRSDVLSLTDVAVNMRGLTQGVTSECLRIDGGSNTIRAKSLALLGCGYGLRIMNSSGASVPGSAGNAWPEFGFFQDLEIEAWISAVRIEAGYDWYFSNSLVNNYHDTNPADATVEIFPDLGASITRSVVFNGGAIKPASGTCLRVNGVHGFYLTGSLIAACGTHAGPNASPPVAPVAAIEVGADAWDFIATGNQIGYVFGSGISAGTDYAVRIKPGAHNVLLGLNNYTLFNGTGIVDNQAGSALSMASGGIGVNSGGFGSTYASGAATGVNNPGATNETFLRNNGTTAGTNAQINVATGTASAYTLMNNSDGPVPTGLISTGVGDTGGLLFQSSVGPTSVQSVANDVRLIPSGNVQLTNAGSWDSNTANCGSVAGSTRCMVIKDNAGVIRKVPAF